MTSHMTQFSLMKIYTNVYVRAFFSMCVVIFAHDQEQNENSKKFFFKSFIILFFRKEKGFHSGLLHRRNIWLCTDIRVQTIEKKHDKYTKTYSLQKNLDTL